MYGQTLNPKPYGFGGIDAWWLVAVPVFVRLLVPYTVNPSTVQDHTYIYIYIIYVCVGFRV